MLTPAERQKAREFLVDELRPFHHSINLPTQTELAQARDDEVAAKEALDKADDALDVAQKALAWHGTQVSAGALTSWNGLLNAGEAKINTAITGIATAIAAQRSIINDPASTAQQVNDAYKEETHLIDQKQELQAQLTGLRDELALLQKIYPHLKTVIKEGGKYTVKNGHGNNPFEVEGSKGLAIDFADRASANIFNWDDPTVFSEAKATGLGLSRSDVAKMIVLLNRLWVEGW